jgi:signal transduction histidine kinase
MGQMFADIAPRTATDEQRRILVVDDEPSLCLIARKTLRRTEYTVEATTEPLQALQRLQKAEFDLLITDISMPGMTGLELAEQARALHPLLGIVFMTGYGSFENVTRALQTGIDDFLIKPFDIEMLRATVRRALDRQRLRRDNVQLQTLVNVFEYSRTINATLDLDLLHDVVVSTVKHETGAAEVALWIVNNVGELVPHGGSVLAETSHESASALVERVYVDGAPQTIDWTDTLHGEHQWLYAQPLIVGDERIGVLVASYATQRPAALNELLGIIANQAALAIRNARQHHALTEINNLKSDFIGIASHELRTPLSLVLGYSSLLRHRLQGRERELLEQVIAGALRIGDIVDDLITLRRTELHQNELQLATVDLWKLVRDAAEEMFELATARGIDMDVRCPDEPLLVVVDQEKLLLALAHVVDNATKFTDAGGSITIQGCAPLPDAPEYATIEVRDTGIGMTRRDLSRIFERFYQAEPSITRMHGGLGVGLVLTRMMVELHGGQVQVESESGKGSLVRIRLPLRPPDAPFAAQE